MDLAGCAQARGKTEGWQEGAGRARRVKPWGLRHICCKPPQGGTGAALGKSPLRCSATSAVPLGGSRGTCGGRAPRGGARETESAPKTSPLPRVAAKTVAFGRFHATCRAGAPRTVPRETSRAEGPSPLGCSVARASWEGPKALTVPGLGGFRGVRARNPWQCQSWVASGASAPEIPGSARAGWQLPETPGSANAQWRHCRKRPIRVPAPPGTASQYQTIT